MACIATIVGISGLERYLAHGREVTERKLARRFRSVRAASEAAEAHINAFPRVVARAMAYKVVGVDASLLAAGA